MFDHLFASTFETVECLIFTVAAIAAVYFDSRRGSEIADLAASGDEADRVLAAKKLNEGLRLTATLLNNLAVGLFVGGIITPVATGRDLDPLRYAALTFTSVGLHFAGRFLLKDIKREE